MSDMINQIVSKEAEEQVVRITKLLKENMDAIKAHETLLRSSTTGAQVRDNAEKLSRANEDFSKTEKEIIALAEKRRNLLTEQAKQVAELKAQNRSLLESQTKLAAVNESERNSLERAQKLILLYTNEKKKLNLATEEGARLNENYNKAIQKANDFIIKNADVETKRAKNVGNYAGSLAPLFNNLAASITQAETAVRLYTKSEGDQSPKTKQAISELSALKQVFNDVSTQAALAGQTEQQFIQATKASITNLKESGLQGSTIYRDLTTGLNSTITPTIKATGGFNAMGNAVSQLAREAPAFANSVSTGFMAISNNLPILFDAISGIREQNKGLQAEGKPTVSVLKQIGSAFFSWGTLLSVGVTLLTLYGKDIVDFIGTIFKGTEAMNAFAEKQRLMNEAFKDSSVKDAVKDIYSLKINIELAKQGLLDKEKVVKQYNESIGKTTGLVETLDQAEKGIVANGPDYIQMMLLKAAALLALEEAAKSALLAEQARQKDIKEFSSFTEFDGGLAGYGSSMDLNENARESREKKIAANREERRQKEIKRNQEAADTQKRIAEKLQSDAAAIAARNKGWNFFGDNDKDAKASDKASKDAERASKKAESARKKDLEQQKRDAEEAAKIKAEAAKKVFDANYELMKEESQNSADNAQKIQDDELKSLNERLEASIQFYANKQNLLDLEQTKEIYEAEGNQVAITAINAKYAKSREQLLKEHYAQRSVIIKSAHDKELELALKALDKEKEKYDNYSLEALRDLDDQYAQGWLSTEDYEKQRSYISQMAMQNSLRAQLSFAEKKLEELKKDGVDTIEIETKISELRQKIAEGDANIYSSIHSDNKKNVKELEDAWSGAAQSSIELINSITDALAQNAERQAEIKKKLVDEDEKRELDSLNRRALTANQKEEEKLRIELAADNKRKEIDREKVSRLRKYAAIQKAADIANIISGTALAVVNALKTQPTYLGIALALGVGITGAAQLARAIATPLPQYAKGRKGGPAEFALVGEAGPEVIDEPGKKPYVVDKPTVTWLSAGASVIPTNEALMKSLFAPTIVKLASAGNPVTSDNYGKAMIESFEKEIGGLKKVIRENKTSVNIYGGSDFYTKQIIG